MRASDRRGVHLLLVIFFFFPARSEAQHAEKVSEGRIPPVDFTEQNRNNLRRYPCKTTT
jgi:hypothetical protein